MNKTGEWREEPNQIPAAGNGPDDPRVARALEEYLEAAEQGQKPNRREFLGRHPDVAGALAECLDGLEFVNLAAAQVLPPACGSEDGSAPDGLQPEAPLGDFRIVRAVGRGGMGVVYEAVQLSLGRRVALKVLPFAAAMDPKQLQRFQNEAHAVAQLHHSNIVPVYGVGCERGVHYYAMQFIDGQNLAEVVGDLRRLNAPKGGTEAAETPAVDPDSLAGQLASGRLAPARTAARRGDATGSFEPPPPAARPASGARSSKDRTGLSGEGSHHSAAFLRTVAGLGVQAAEALEYAHTMGVVHRDIKPANLLVDARGHLWVTDFGLALMQTDVKLTMTGDLLGTLRYMSPEQALAKRVVIDHRTDVYSLGATLYELLTLEHVFSGADRQELLRQIAFEEARPPRRLNRSIPADLETIVLKAVEKNPADRYQSAQELADDLKRFMEDRPVKARRATVGQRLGKWARRHRTAVTTGAVMLLLSVIGLAGSTAVIWRTYNRESAQSRRTQRNLQIALESLDGLYLRVAEKRLPSDPQRAKEDRDLLQAALAFYERFAAENRGDPGVLPETGKAYVRVGDILNRLGEHTGSDNAYGTAITVYTQLAAASPTTPEYRRLLAAVHDKRGTLLNKTGRPREAEEAYRQAQAFLKGLAAEYPEDVTYERDLAVLAENLGVLFATSGRLREAEQALSQALQSHQRLMAAGGTYQGKPAGVYLHLGNVLQLLGRSAEAEKSLRQAVDSFKDLAASFPDAPEHRLRLAAAWGNLGNTLQRADRPREAIGPYRDALAVVERLHAEFPAVPEYQDYLAGCYTNLSTVLQADQMPEREQACRRAVSLGQQLVQDHPAVPGYRYGLASSHLNLGTLLATTGRPREAEKSFRTAVKVNPDSSETCNAMAWFLATAADLTDRNPAEAVDLARKAIERAPQVGNYRGIPNLPNYWGTLGTAHYRAGDWNAAATELQKAIKLRGDNDSANSHNMFFLAMTYWHLGEKEQARSWHDRAVALMAMHNPRDEELRRFRAEAATVLGIAGVP